MFAKTLKAAVPVTLVLSLACCAAQPKVAQLDPVKVARLTVELPRQDWGPVVVRPAPDALPVRLSESGVSTEDVGSSQ